MAQKTFIIAGLRCFPSISASLVPGYLIAATERHRYGFQLSSEWLAFSHDPIDAVKFPTEETATAYVRQLLTDCPLQCGWPLVIQPVWVC
jgi:hypothetical protein